LWHEIIFLLLNMSIYLHFKILFFFYYVFSDVRAHMHLTSGVNETKKMLRTLKIGLFYASLQKFDVLRVSFFKKSFHRLL
jgi:hypothetical protein